MAVFGTSSTIQLDTVVFATDFSPASHNAGLYASAISVRFHTKLVVAHAFALVPAAEEAELMTQKPSMQRRDLDHDLALAADVLEAGVDRPEPVLLRGDWCKSIPDYALTRHPSLLVLGTHGGGRIDRFVLGSTAEGVLRNSSGAALTIGPRVNILQAGGAADPAHLVCNGLLQGSRSCRSHSRGAFGSIRGGTRCVERGSRPRGRTSRSHEGAPGALLWSRRIVSAP